MLTGPSTEVLAKDDNNNSFYGVNYASADYLGLAQHPEAKKAAIKPLKNMVSALPEPLQPLAQISIDFIK